MKKIAIFGSGSGSNAEKICEFFNNSKNISIVLIATNNKESHLITRAKKRKIPLLVFSKKELSSFTYLHSILKKKGVTHIVLAGFLLKIPSVMINAFSEKIINLHPSLLPKYGGKGMFGVNVHVAVLKNHEQKSGITIHLVNENYDEGEILFQKSCPINSNETAFSLSKKIQLLEHMYFPVIIQKFLS